MSIFNFLFSTKKRHKKWIDNFVYKSTKKPKHYKEVKNPPVTFWQKLSRPQDARQIQYNTWSKKHKVYSGSYLPKDENKLLKQGWINENSKISSTANSKIPNFFRRKSTNQWVRHDTDNKKQGNHWHWYNWWKKEKMPNGFTKKNSDAYLDKYGKTCERDSPQSHIKEHD
ncbi:MAG: hypothetical protein J6C23_06945 [Clostridia bacterium]|nr:hypothetical protein [Clostridia bacterium]